MNLVLPVSGLILEVEKGADGLAYSCRQPSDPPAVLTPVPLTPQVCELRSRRSPGASWLVALGSLAAQVDVQLRCRRAIGWMAVTAYRADSALWWAEVSFAPSALQVVIDGLSVDVPLQGAGLPIALPTRRESAS